MSGRQRIEELTNEWYGFTIVSLLVQVVMALFGTGVLAVVTVPFVIGVGVISLVIVWAIGRLLIKKSSLTRLVLLVLAPVIGVLDMVGFWELATGPWSLGVVVSLLLGAAGIWMCFHSFLVLMRKDVRAYFG